MSSCMTLLWIFKRNISKLTIVCGCVNMHDKYFSPIFRMWMFGPMGAVDPDTVDNDAGNVWRNLYKLEKTFGDSPNPQKMAKFVSQQHPAWILIK